MRISVTYEETDVAKALGKIIKDPNSAEFIKLLTPMLCTSVQGTEQFFKLMLGNQLPDVIPIGTLCKIHVDSLGYSSNKDLIQEKFGDELGKVVVTVKEFRGYHEYTQYMIEYTDVLPAGTTKKDSTYVQGKLLEVIEEI
jgi:hypothetical protein